MPNISFNDESDEYVFDRIALLLMVTDVKLEVLLKAFFPMLVTLVGMVTDLRLVQPSNA